MEKKIVAILLQIPAILLLVGAFVAAIVARAMNYPGVESYGTAVILAIIVGLYFWGRYLEKNSKEFF
jgi:hypothetical protein